jgi:hypothetical protein
MSLDVKGAFVFARQLSAPVLDKIPGLLSEFLERKEVFPALTVKLWVDHWRRGLEMAVAFVQIETLIRLAMHK